MLRSPYDEKRTTPRKRMLKGGVVAFSARHATLPCVIRDLSDTGARIQVKNTASVPDTFELIVELDGLEVATAVVWRSATELGVEFVSPITKVAPKRAQVIDVSVPQLFRPKASLRRSPTLVEKPEPGIRPATPDFVAAAPQPVAPASPAKATAGPDMIVPIVICDDDADDQQMIEDAFRNSRFKHPFTFVSDGEDLLRYLRAQAPYQDRIRPGMLLLDLNMPRMDGRTALMHIKTDASLRSLPIIVMTTSNADDDIQRTYELGISAFITKPSSVDGLMEMVEALDKYWLRLAQLPYRAAMRAQ